MLKGATLEVLSKRVKKKQQEQNAVLGTIYFFGVFS
jgi:hypothetical protein